MLTFFNCRLPKNLQVQKIIMSQKDFCSKNLMLFIYISCDYQSCDFNVYQSAHVNRYYALKNLICWLLCIWMLIFYGYCYWISKKQKLKNMFLSNVKLIENFAKKQIWFAAKIFLLKKFGFLTFWQILFFNFWKKIWRFFQEILENLEKCFLEFENFGF